MPLKRHDLRLRPRKCQRVMRKCPWRVSHLHGGDSAQRRAVVYESKKMCNSMWSSGGKHLGFSWWDTPALTPDSDLGKHSRGVEIIITLQFITSNWSVCSGFTINVSEQGQCSPELNAHGYLKEYKTTALNARIFWWHITSVYSYMFWSAALHKLGPMHTVIYRHFYFSHQKHADCVVAATWTSQEFDRFSALISLFLAQRHPYASKMLWAILVPCAASVRESLVKVEARKGVL